MTTKVAGAFSDLDFLAERPKGRKEKYLATPRVISSERSRLVTQSWKETEGQPLLIRRAKALQRVLEEIPIVIRYEVSLLWALQVCVTARFTLM